MGLAADVTHPPGLADLVGHTHVRTEGPALAAAAVDGLLPRIVVYPGSADETSRVMAHAHAHGFGVTPRGAGTALGLGNPPARYDLVLDLARLNRVVEYEPADVSITVEAGMRLSDLQGVLGAHRQLLPLDPPAAGVRSVGGVLATNASGPLRARYGTGRDLLLGLRFVQADGTITRGGSKVVKSVTGYDIPKLMVGALGTLGVIVEATLRLHPAPASVRSWLATFPSLAAAHDALGVILDSPQEPARLEILNSDALSALGHPAEVGIAACFAGVKEAVDVEGDAVARFVRRGGGSIGEISNDFWTAYAGILGGTAGSAVRLRIACLHTSVTAVIARVEALAVKRAFRAIIGGRAGVGALTAALAGDLDPVGWSEQVIRPLRQHLAAEGGSVVVERCARALKDATDVWGPVGEPELALMRRVKEEFDPDRILNPGRFAGGL